MSFFKWRGRKKSTSTLLVGSGAKVFGDDKKTQVMDWISENGGMDNYKLTEPEGVLLDFKLREVINTQGKMGLRKFLRYRPVHPI